MALHVLHMIQFKCRIAHGATLFASRYKLYHLLDPLEILRYLAFWVYILCVSKPRSH